MEWNRLDYLIAAIVLISVVASFIKGFVRELISLATLAGGILAAAWYYDLLAPWFLDYVKTPEIAALAAFLGILAAALLLGAMVSSLAGKMVKQAGLKWFDRVLGLSFGLLRGALLAMALVLALTAFRPGSPAVESSQFAPYLVYGSRLIAAAAPAELSEQFRAGVELARRIWNKRGRPAPPPNSDIH